jgi:hypothetical protein
MILDLIDEFSAHLVFGGQVADRLRLGEHLDGDNFSDIRVKLAATERFGLMLWV